MCGISGYLHFDSNLVANEQRLEEMNNCLFHRGPDAKGIYVKKNLALGHRRLSIIDLVGGEQPMQSDSGDIVLVFNGEIYNYIELRKELSSLGITFKTGSDTEVIIKAYEQWGHECQNKFNGMWAFALWDNVKGELFLSRDRIGEKPLHYAVYNNTFVFGSEIKSILNFGLPKQCRLELLEVYLSLTNIPAPDTFFKDIFKLLPGHYLLVRNGKVIKRNYWKFPQIKESEMIRDKQFVYRKFAELFDDAVKIRMRSDVPFGAFLSGGLDSSAVVAVMAKNSKFPVKTFTIGFDDPAFDESGLADEVAKEFKTVHHRGTVLPGDFERAIQRIAFHYDEPFGDSSAIPTDFVSAFASKEVKMVLTGDGGDELLSGYNAYKGIKITERINRFLPRILKKGLVSIINVGKRFLKGPARYRFDKIVKQLVTSGLPFTQRLAEKVVYTPVSEIKKMTSDIKGIIPIEMYLTNLFRDCTFQDDFYKLMYFHYIHSLPNDYLVKVDRMSMANSIETRLPFLDHRLIEFMATVHKDVKMQGWELKSVLRKTIGNDLPENILQAPKRGFGIPLREWFKDKDVEEVLNKNLSIVFEILNNEAVQKVISENKEGKRDNGNFIWTLLQLNTVLKEC